MNVLLMLILLQICLAGTLLTTKYRITIECDQSCLTCTGTSDEQCLTCSNNDLIVYKGKCICGVGKYLSNGQCLDCHGTCEACKNPSATQCLACYSSQFRTLSSGQCICISGYFDNGSLICQQCLYECQTCLNTTTCSSCKTPYIMIGSICGMNWLSTTTQCHYTCDSCSGSNMNQCLSCQSNRSLLNGVCQCTSSSYYETNSRACITCPVTCSTCKAETQCYTCKSGYRLVNNECICQSGKQKFNCSLSCPTGCDICNNSTCYTCISPYILQGSSCVCPNQRSGTGCTTLCASECKYCDYWYDCTQCDTTTRWLHVGSQSCFLRPYGCYDWNGSSCSQCMATTYTYSNCTCADGYVGASTLGQCVLCHPKCQTCNGFTQNDCITYQPGVTSPGFLYWCGTQSGTTCTSCNTNNTFRSSSISTNCNCLTGYYNQIVCPFYYCRQCQDNAVTPTCQYCGYYRDINQNCQCYLGYYDLGYLSDCQPCSNNCYSCINYDKCTQCYSNYALTYDFKCELIIRFNYQYLSLTNTCRSGYYYKSDIRQCLPCKPQCNSCQNSANYCTSCASGFSGTPTCSCQRTQDMDSLVCQICPSNCSECSLAGVCTQCASNRMQNPPNCDCPLNQLSQWNQSYCYTCASQCKECRYSHYYCTKCISTRVNEPTCDKTCDIKCGTCINQSDNCVTCVGINRIIPTCDCMSGYYDVPGLQCQQCSYKCQECVTTSTNCTTCAIHRGEPLDTCKCKPGYFESGQICLPCHFKCLECETTPIYCTNCGIGEFLQLNTCICKLGYYDVPGQNCQQCNFKCQQCITTATNCIECSNFRVISPDCLCSPGYYENGVASCQKCYYQCLTCVGTHDNCTSCDPNLNRTLVGSECHCMDTFIKFNNQCKCDLLEFQNIALHKCELCDKKCLRCELSATNCLICQIHRVNQPVCNCQDQYYMDVNSDCQICNYKCATCTFESTKCTKCYSTRAGIPSCNCQDGYFESFNQICNICQSVCKTCIGPDVNQCTSCDDTANRKYATGMICECKDKFVERDSKCIPCEIQYPECQPFICGDGLLVRGEQCDDGNNNDRDGCSAACLIEPQSYCQLMNHPLYPTLYLSKCVKCSPYCTKCNDTQCLVCQTQYFLVQNILCRPCNLHCQSCSGPEQNQCITCATGYDYGFKVKCAFCEETVGLITAGDKCVNVCGDGILKSDYGEVCDDGNIADGDGCSSSCEVEIEYSCSAEESTISVCIKLDYPKASLLILNSVSGYQTYRAAQLRYTKQMQYIKGIESQWIYQLQDYNNSYFNVTQIEQILDMDNYLIGFDFRIELLQSIKATNFIIQFNNTAPITDLLDGYNYLDDSIKVQYMSIFKCIIKKYDAVLESTVQQSQKAVDMTTNMLIIISASCGLGILLGGFTFLWNILDSIQQMSYLIYLNVNYPFILHQFLNLFNFAQFNFIDDLLDDKYLDFIDGYLHYRDAQLFMKEVQPQLLLNLKSSIMISVGSFIFYLTCRVTYQFTDYLINQLKYLKFYSLIKPIHKILKFIKHASYNYHSNYFHLITIRLYLSMIYDLNQALFTTYYYYGYETSNLSLVIEAAIALTLFIIQNALMFHQYGLLYFTQEQLKSKKNSRLYGAISDGVNISEFNSFMSVTQILRKQLFMFFLIGLYDNPVMQCICLLLLNFTFTVLLLVELPFRSRIENIKLVISELAAIASLIISVGYCIVQQNIYEIDTDTFNMVGIVQIGIYAFMLGANLLLDLVDQFGQLIKRNPKIIQKIKGLCQK